MSKTCSIKSIKLDKKDPNSIYKWIIFKISNKEFRDVIKKYIDDNCLKFMDEEENSHEQGNIFNAFNNMVEKLLNSILKEGNITQEEFLAASERGINDPKYQKLFYQIIYFGNYPFFKCIMTKRNHQLMKAKKKKEDNYSQNNMETTDIDNDLINKLTPELVKLILDDDKEQLEQYQIDNEMRESLEKELKKRLAIIEEEERRRNQEKEKKEDLKKEKETKTNKEEKIEIDEDEKKYTNTNETPNLNNKNTKIPNPFQRKVNNIKNPQESEKEKRKAHLKQSIKKSIVKYEGIIHLLVEDNEDGVIF